MTSFKLLVVLVEISLVISLHTLINQNNIQPLYNKSKY